MDVAEPFYLSLTSKFTIHLWLTDIDYLSLRPHKIVFSLEFELHYYK